MEECTLMTAKQILVEATVLWTIQVSQVGNNVVKFSDKDVFVANQAAGKVAAICASSTNLIFQGSSLFINNSVKYSDGVESTYKAVPSHLCSMGWGIIQESPLDCNICNDFSSIYRNYFCQPHNTLRWSTVYSNLNLHQSAHVHFQDNYATEFGGAMLCFRCIPFLSECFFHIATKWPTSWYFDNSTIVIANNSAAIRGSVLYCGLLGKCSYKNLTSMQVHCMLFNIYILQGNDDNSISSDPTQALLM